MKFEHLVQINDPKLPGVGWLTREQLWFGLVARAWRPVKFIMGLEEAEVTESERQGNVTTLKRRLNYGTFQINDTISLVDEQRTETRVAANPYCGRSSMVISIEEPEDGQLWLRFQYELDDSSTTQASNEGNAQAADLSEYRKQAYRAADIDTVKMIRELALTLPSPGESIHPASPH